MKILDRENYNRLTKLVQQVPFNNLFARSVIEKKVLGKVFVDDIESPETCYIVHPYGMSLLAGNTENSHFNNQFRDYCLNTGNTRSSHEWMQVFPTSWEKVLESLFGKYLIKSEHNTQNIDRGIIELNTRINFQFNKEKFLAHHKPNSNPHIRIQRTNQQLFREMKGSVVPANFWNTEHDFLKNGISFSLLYDEQLASMAFSSFLFDDQLELGIETIKEFRGMGLGEIVCASLIEYCLQNNYTPVWACRLENTASYKLALKLGFEVSASLPYYRLSN